MAVRPRSGPAGTGLIPPGVRGADPEEEVDDLDEDLDEPEDDIDSVPPVDDDDRDEDDDDVDDNDGGDPQSVDAQVERILNARLSQMEAAWQKRFDRAVSRQRKKLERQYASRSTGAANDDDDEDDEEPETPPRPKKRRPAQRQDRAVDVTSIRLLARDQIADELADAGKAERARVKRLVDTILPAVDWNEVDPEDFVPELISELRETTQELVKAGSDRKVAQLRRMGRLPDRQGQPPAGGRSGKKEAESAMEKGASIASRRFPDGKRRLFS